jgi:predicted transcriptional regulator
VKNPGADATRLASISQVNSSLNVRKSSLTLRMSSYNIGLVCSRPHSIEVSLMTKRDLPRPTDAELAILRVLWERGPSTVRDVTDALQAARGTGYTTALKLMQIMTDKGLVRRDDSKRTHVYVAVAPAEETQQQLVGDLLERAFGGSAQQLVLQALSSKKASKAELAEIRKLLDQMEKKAK